MKRVMTVFFVFLLVACSFGYANVSEAKAKYEFSLATKIGPQSPEFKAFERFADLVHEKSEGQIKFNLFGAQVLGNDETVFKSLNMGAIDIVAGSPSLGSRIYVPRIEYITPPFVYTDYEHFKRFLTSDYSKSMYKELEEKGNVVVLNSEWTWKRGPYRVICTKKPISSVDDVQGMKLRFYPSEFEMSVWKALGAVPNVIAWSETYLALQQGMVESVTSPVTLINDTKFVEVCPYVTRTNEYPQTLAFFMNKNKFRSLPEDLQKTVLDACNQAGEEYSAKLDSVASGVLDEARKTYNITYSEIDMSSFIEKAKTHYASLKKKGSMPEEFWEIIDAIEQVR